MNMDTLKYLFLLLISAIGGIIYVIMLNCFLYKFPIKFYLIAFIIWWIIIQGIIYIIGRLFKLSPFYYNEILGLFIVYFLSFIVYMAAAYMTFAFFFLRGM